MVAHAQQLKVLASGTSLNPKAENSTSYIEVTGRNAQGAQTFQHQCQPNVVCVIPTVAGTVSSSSRLVYDSQRERLTACNGEAVTSEGAPCERTPGVLTATLQVRLGKLKITAKPDTGYSGLQLNTVGASVKLEFVESAEDQWTFGYSNSNFGQANQFQNVPAGRYKVVATDLSQHCKPTQSNAGMTFTVNETTSGGEQQELIVLFRANTCQLKVVRSASAGATIGTLTSTPPGLDCAAGSSTCEGAFAFDTQITLTPSGRFSWTVGQGCVPTSAPCSVRIASDRTLDLRFNVDVDGGMPTTSPDAGAGMDDTPQATLDAGGTADAAAPSPMPPAPGLPASDAGSSESDGGGGCAMAGRNGTFGALWVWALAMAGAALRRRKR